MTQLEITQQRVDELEFRLKDLEAAATKQALQLDDAAKLIEDLSRAMLRITERVLGENPFN